MSWIKADGYVIECNPRKTVLFFSALVTLFLFLLVHLFVCFLFYFMLVYWMVGFLIRLIVIRSFACSFIAPNQNVPVVYALLLVVGGTIVSVSGSREQN